MTFLQYQLKSEATNLYPGFKPKYDDNEHYLLLDYNNINETDLNNLLYLSKKYGTYEQIKEILLTRRIPEQKVIKTWTNFLEEFTPTPTEISLDPIKEILSDYEYTLTEFQSNLTVQERKVSNLYYIINFNFEQLKTLEYSKIVALKALFRKYKTTRYSENIEFALSIKHNFHNVHILIDKEELSALFKL